MEQEQWSRRRGRAGLALASGTCPAAPLPAVRGRGQGPGLHPGAWCAPFPWPPVLSGSSLEPPHSVASERRQARTPDDTNMFPQDLKSHLGLFAELLGARRDYSRALQPRQSLCTLLVTAFACGPRGRGRPLASFCRHPLWRGTEASWLPQDPGCALTVCARGVR